jgi:cell volume regulation protein A
MEVTTIKGFLLIGTIIFIGFFGNFIFTRFRIPDVLILVFLGMVIGPDLLGERISFIPHGLVTEGALDKIQEFDDVFLSAALILILFDGGLSLNIRTVMESMRLTAFMSIAAFFLTFLTVGLALHFIMGTDLLITLTLGAIVGGTSGAIVIPIVNKMRIKPQTKAMLITESIVTDVLVIVVTLTMLTVILTGELNAMSITRDLASKFLLGGAIGFIAGVAWLFILQRLQNQPLSYIMTIAMLFLVAGVVELSPISSSGAVAALAFGLAISNRQFVKRYLTSLSLTISPNVQIQQFHSEITFFVRTFFFVYLGLLFRFDSFTATHLVAGLLIISVIVLVRWIASMMAWKLGDLNIEDAETVFASMPRGLAAAVLATLPATLLAAAGTSAWVNDPDDLGLLFLNATLIVILGTTILTTIFSFITEKGIDRRQRIALRNRLKN